MKLITILFLFSIPTFAKAPDCPEIKSLVDELEASYQKLNADECQKLESKNLDVKVKEGFPSADQDALIKEYRCKDLAAIDLQLKMAENQLAMIEGLKKLKIEVAANLAKVKTIKKVEDATVAAQSFVANLEVAKHLELMLREKTPKNKTANFLEHIASQEVDVLKTMTLETFNASVQKYCIEKKDKDITLCSEHFKPGPEVFKEIHAFIMLGRETEPKFNPQHIKDLDAALAIDKAGKPYSFSSMSIAIKDKLITAPVITKDTVKLIKGLPDFQGSDKFSFLVKMKEAKQSLDSQANEAQYNNFLGDLKQRQEWEIKSKLSILIREFAPELAETKNLENCKASLKTLANIPECLGPILPKLGTKSASRKANLNDMISEFRISQDYLKLIELLQKDCKLDENGDFPKPSGFLPLSCHGMVLGMETDVQAKHVALSALKNKILSQNTDLETFRNFAIEKFEAHKCPGKIASLIEGCDSPMDISKTALVLTGEALDAIIVQSTQTKDTDVEELCEDKEVRISHKSALCKLNEFENESDYENYDKDQFQGRNLDAYQKNPMAAAGNEVLSNILGYAVNTLTMQPMRQTNYGPSFTYDSAGTARSYSQKSAEHGAALGALQYPSSFFGR